MTPAVKSSLRSYALAAAVAVTVAACAFVAERNHDFQAAQRARARAVAAAVAHAGRADAGVAAGGAVAGVVLPPKPSPKYPFLRRRQLASGRTLGGPDAPATDKLLYDAAGRAEAKGPFSEILTDGSGRTIAAVRAPRGFAIALVPARGSPEPFPWWIVLGLLAVGALVAGAGGMVGGGSRPLAIALGASGLAVPAYLWGGPAPAGVIVASALAIAWADHRGAVDRAAAELRRQRAAYTFFAPAALAMLVLVAIPFFTGIALGFFNHHNGQWTFVGFDNFINILSGGGRPLTDPLNFWFTLAVTIAWTGANLCLHVTIGVSLALALRQPWMRARGIFRVLFIVPWAIPNYITALIWRGMFESQFGAINQILVALGLDRVSWFSHWITSFSADVVTNTWLGFPFMMVVALGALESIPRDLYEAAEVDGASRWQRFKHITLPHLRPALLPAVVMGGIWTFNMFNVIYLVSNGAPGGGTDILVTQAYRWAFERGERYGLASAYATLIFLILLVWTLIATRRRKEAS